MRFIEVEILDNGHITQAVLNINQVSSFVCGWNTIKMINGEKFTLAQGNEEKFIETLMEEVE